jgi:signal transduction histidine kinase
LSAAALPVLDAAVGVTLLGTGALAAVHRRTSRVGPLLVLAGGCWFLGNLAGPLVFLHRGPLVHLHVTYPTGRAHRRVVGAVVVLAYAAALYDGFVADDWVTLGLAVLVAATAIDLYRRTSGPARKAGGPALAAALGFAAVLAFSSANQVLGLGLDLSMAVLYDVAVALIAVGLTLDLLAGRWTEATVADLVSQLAPDTDAIGLQAALRRAVGDTGLVLGYWSEQAGYVDDAGRPVELHLRDDQVATTIDDDGRPAAILVHAAAVREDARLLDSAVAAARLAVVNARMRDEARERVARLAEARRRIVEAGDEQRRVLAEQLSDGAQAHLSALDDSLAGLAADADGDAERAATLGMLRAEVAEAQREVSDLAQGIRPAALASGGLAAALPELGRRSGLPVSVTVRVGRVAPAVEAAVYFVCAEALGNAAKHAHPEAVALVVRREGEVLHVDVVDDGCGGTDASGSGLRGLADRVEALGGTFSAGAAGPDGRGTRVSARLPVEGYVEAVTS